MAGTLNQFKFKKEKIILFLCEKGQGYLTI
jgi:hypothetical protein